MEHYDMDRSAWGRVNNKQAIKPRLKIQNEKMVRRLLHIFKEHRAQA